MSRLKAAKRMRREPASTERLLWSLLRNRRLEGLKFRRQVPIGPYIADFVCFRHRLIVEADGYWHDAAKDERRDAWLRDQGFRVLRFDNLDIANNSDLVLSAIFDCTRPKDDPPPPEPLVRDPRVLMGTGRRFNDAR